ncbi:PAT complex subunit Asterix [Anaeramoeba flamelloides]|uniref:PAT complex subunit Asterix n=1 Tax=Anaeramoeba flamelloides TaxID=1746091 RepID=A0ABQ8X9Y6_9EUKA|nr:PAT complex subunit Asterix [Anaeramoeba flamelloides]
MSKKDPRRENKIKKFDSNYYITGSGDSEGWNEIINLFALGLNLISTFLKNHYLAWFGFFISLSTLTTKHATSSSSQMIPSIIFSIVTLGIHYITGRRMPIKEMFMRK